MPGFIVRPGGGREYLPKEYRGTPQDYYASRIREARRNGKNSLHISRTAGLEKDRSMNNELARLRARYRELVNKTRLLKRDDGIQITESPRIRFAPRV
jgi:hypothetical protein